MSPGWGPDGSADWSRVGGEAPGGWGHPFLATLRQPPPLAPGGCIGRCQWGQFRSSCSLWWSHSAGPLPCPKPTASLPHSEINPRVPNTHWGVAPTQGHNDDDGEEDDDDEDDDDGEEGDDDDDDDATPSSASTLSLALS